MDDPVHWPKPAPRLPQTPRLGSRLSSHRPCSFPTGSYATVLPVFLTRASNHAKRYNQTSGYVLTRIKLRAQSVTILLHSNNPKNLATL
jgi:hypothetical protein